VTYPVQPGSPQGSPVVANKGPLAPLGVGMSPAEREALVQREYASAVHAVQTLLAMAQGRARRLLIEELEHTDWGRELAGIAADLVLSPFNETGDSVAPDGTVQHTLLVALDEHGQRVATLHGPGWNGRALYPAALQWARGAGAPVSWLRKGAPLLVRDGRFVLATEPATLSLAQCAQGLTEAGWHVTPTERGFNATRAVYARDWPALVLLVLIGTLLFPVTVLVFAYVLFKKLTTGAWPGDDSALAAWRKAEDRVALDCAPGRLRVVQTQAGRPVFDRVYDRRTLQSVWVETPNANSPPLTLIEADRLSYVPTRLRGEIPSTRDPQERTAALLAQAIVAVWSKPD
jgi:hypothetical protein